MNVTLITICLKLIFPKGENFNYCQDRGRDCLCDTNLPPTLILCRDADRFDDLACEMLLRNDTLREKIFVLGGGTTTQRAVDNNTDIESFFFDTVTNIPKETIATTLATPGNTTLADKISTLAADLTPSEPGTAESAPRTTTPSSSEPDAESAGLSFNQVVLMAVGFGVVALVALALFSGWGGKRVLRRYRSHRRRQSELPAVSAGPAQPGESRRMRHIRRCTVKLAKASQELDYHRRLAQEEAEAAEALRRLASKAPAPAASASSAAAAPAAASSEGEEGLGARRREITGIANETYQSSSSATSDITVVEVGKSGQKSSLPDWQKWAADWEGQLKEMRGRLGRKISKGGDSLEMQQRPSVASLQPPAAGSPIAESAAASASVPATVQRKDRKKKRSLPATLPAETGSTPTSWSFASTPPEVKRRMTSAAAMADPSEAVRQLTLQQRRDLLEQRKFQSLRSLPADQGSEHVYELPDRRPYLSRTPPPPVPLKFSAARSRKSISAGDVAELEREARSAARSLSPPAYRSPPPPSTSQQGRAFVVGQSEEELAETIREAKNRLRKVVFEARV